MMQPHEKGTETQKKTPDKLTSGQTHKEQKRSHFTSLYSHVIPRMSTLEI